MVNPLATILFDLLLAGTACGVLARELALCSPRRSRRAQARIERAARTKAARWRRERTALGPARSRPFP